MDSFDTLAMYRALMTVNEAACDARGARVLLDRIHQARSGGNRSRPDLAALERWAERSLGLCVSGGQESGLISRKGHQARLHGPLPDPSDFYGHGTLWHACRTYAEFTPDIFESAIEAAAATGHLGCASRVGVLAQLKGATNPPATAPAGRPAELKKRRRLDANRIVEETVRAVDVPQSTLDGLDYTTLNVEHVPEWTYTLRRSMRIIRRLLNDLEMIITNDEPIESAPSGPPDVTEVGPTGEDAD